ncbi:TIGR02234 family membrane protein [Actinomadura algeriensis]|uniref:Membrane protein (TIGR02234 family) n=1 Tax=Actinomadura algeriensis TaxID=1679523 RepID=A0ABR9JZ12_9ACTN|nr:TIGR02234 family membrane protein [Actinomadura algeriensis]MBE1535335.1 putative membrane protein (TIGR02234 family) [Actinomadura algeriensis]
MTPGRERGLTALLCAAGAGLVLLAAGRTWATVTADGAITPFTRELTGGDLGGAPAALGWAGLAGLAALFATRGRVRAAVGALIALFGVGAGYAAAVAARGSHVAAEAGDQSALLKLGADPSVHVNAWWLVSVAGGALLVAAGLITVLRGSRWPGMSARYERTAPAASGGPGAAGPRRAPASDDPSAMWKSLDRGEDPTDPAPDGPDGPDGRGEPGGQTADARDGEGAASGNGRK